MRHLVNLGRVSCDLGGMGWLYVENLLSIFYAIPAREATVEGEVLGSLG
jgi:hypothetical protein